MPVVLSIAASLGASSLSEDGSCHDEYAEDDYDDGPKDGPEVRYVSCFLEKEAEADYYDYYTEY